MNNKNIVFAALAGLALVFYSCTLPSAIEVKANPKMSVPAKADFGELFFEAMGKSDINDGGGATHSANVYDCEKVNTLTFLWDMSFKVDISSPSTSIPWSGKTTQDITITSGKTNGVKLDEMNKFFDGFTLEGVTGKMIVSGNTTDARKFAKLFKIELSETGSSSPPSPPLYTPGVPDSDIDLMIRGNNKTDLTQLPIEGDEISIIGDIVNAQRELKFDYKIILPDDTNVDMSSITSDNTITAHLLIWIPLKFKASKENAELKLPEIFPEDKDLFDRKEGEKSDIVEALKNVTFSIRLNHGTFDGKRLILGGGGLTPSTGRQLANQELTFQLTSNDMAVIKVNPPSGDKPGFVPEISILFDKDDTFEIPRNLKTERLSFDADIVYREDL